MSGSSGEGVPRSNIPDQSSQVPNIVNTQDDQPSTLPSAQSSILSQSEGVSQDPTSSIPATTVTDTATIPSPTTTTPLPPPPPPPSASLQQQPAPPPSSTALAPEPLTSRQTSNSSNSSITSNSSTSSISSTTSSSTMSPGKVSSGASKRKEKGNELHLRLLDVLQSMDKGNALAFEPIPASPAPKLPPLGKGRHDVRTWGQIRQYIAQGAYPSLPALQADLNRLFLVHQINAAPTSERYALANDLRDQCGKLMQAEVSRLRRIQGLKRSATTMVRCSTSDKEAEDESKEYAGDLRAMGIVPRHSAKEVPTLGSVVAGIYPPETGKVKPWTENVNDRIIPEASSFGPTHDSTSATLMVREEVETLENIAREEKRIKERRAQAEERKRKEEEEEKKDRMGEGEKDGEGKGIEDLDKAFFQDLGLDVEKLLKGPASYEPILEEAMSKEGPSPLLQVNQQLISSLGYEHDTRDPAGQVSQETLRQTQHLEASLAYLADHVPPKALISTSSLHRAMKGIEGRSPVYPGTLPPNRPFSYASHKATRSAHPQMATVVPTAIVSRTMAYSQGMMGGMGGMAPHHLRPQ
ncbi:MAG: hypothetical protein DHS80DRAFT_21953 [Piptocephalis tieghemiana]|nr:MAG: hypothetical protein DHS80DRAFT_21953 [Piptocephalis tieghemiana]